MTESDEMLMAAVRGGELDKLASLFDRYNGALYDLFKNDLTHSSSVELDKTHETSRPIRTGQADV